MEVVVREVDAKYLIGLTSEPVRNYVQNGYKKTEVGVVPEDWQVRSVSEISNTGGGTTPSRSMHDRYYVNGRHPWVKTTDLNNSVIFTTEENVTDLALAETSLKKHPAGTVVVAMYGGFNQIGRTGLLSATAAINQALIAITPNPQLFDPRYLLANLNYHVDYWKAVASSSRKDPNITSNDVKEYRLSLPSLEEQTAIANALSDVDALINSLEGLIAKKQGIKTATMQQLLTGRTRLPQFATLPDGRPKGIKQSELGTIPEDWELKQIGDFTDCTAGGTPNTSIPGYWDGTHPWMSSGELHLRRVKNVAEKITDLGLRESSTKYIPRFCVLIGLAGQGKTRGTVAVNEIELCTNQSIAAIFPGQSHDTDYLFYNLQTRYEELRGMSAGDGGRGGLNLSIIRKIPVPMPSLDEQNAISSVLYEVDAEISVLTERLDKIRQIKQGMMQELLTGKTRLVKSTVVTADRRSEQEVEAKKATNHNWQFNEAVVISVLADKFASPKFPLGRMRYTKLSYLLHRHGEGRAEGYAKKAAGPYNPKTRYGGPEKIAINNRYVTEVESGKYKGYCSGEHIAKAVEYFDHWYGMDAVNWLEQFRYEKNDQLELLTTVDMAMVELRSKNKEVSVQNVKALIENTSDWKPKLKRAIFSDANIAKAIEASIRHFGD